MHKIHIIKSIILSLVFITSGLEVLAQKVVDYSDIKTYEIGGIKIEGAENRDRTAIKSLAGLTEGKKVKIPGSDIPKAVKSLMKLNLFDDVQVYAEKTEGDVVFLKMILVERPTLSRYSYKGVSTTQHDDLNEILKTILNKGGIVTEAQKLLAKSKIERHYFDKGRPNAKVSIKEVKDDIRPNTVRLEFDVDKGKRVKVDSILFAGNNNISSYKLRSAMSNTKYKCAWFKKSKLVMDDYKQDKNDLIAYYNTKGYRDARIVSDTIYTADETGNFMIKMNIDEGRQYKFRNISWKGNSIYSDDQLARVFGVEKGDVYDSELIETRLRYSQDGRDVSTLYMDEGYLFFQIDPIEIAVDGDSIDIEMRITEGPQATIDNVTIAGNDRTHEDVIRRQLRTRPGQKFSRSQIIRSQREIVNLGYFNPEAIGINTPVNPQRGTVDIEYTLEERPSDQLELSAGYGGGSGLIGTLGVTFNNFSLANIKDRSTWNPLPQGDGQKLSLRIQSNTRAFQTYNFTFTEPWLGGKSPTSFTLGAAYTTIDQSLFGGGKLGIGRIFTGIGKQLRWPDDYFSIQTTLNLEQINLDNYLGGTFSIQRNGQNLPIRDGKYNNLSLQQSITRSSINDPLYPRRGSRVSLSLQLTPPYSLFRGTSDVKLSEKEIQDLVNIRNEERGPANPLTATEIENLVFTSESAKKYNFLEYHKWKVSTEWYFNIVDKLVFKADAKFGFLGGYNSALGAPPFERFKLGGDGLSNQNQGAVTGVEVISLRGYDEEEVNNNQAATVYNKYNLELRYPLSLNPSSTIYFKTFFQAGNAWTSARKYNPFEVKRSVGAGLRVFLPMFGLLGFDYGIGLDRNLGPNAKLKDYGEFHIILGFEPE